MDIIRIVIRPWEQRFQGRKEEKSSSVIALAQNHESFSAIKSFRKDRREGKAVPLTNQRRQVRILGINEVALSNEAGGCTQRARATDWEQVGLKRWVQGSLVGCSSCGSLQRSGLRHFRLDGWICSRQQDAHVHAFVHVGGYLLSTSPEDQRRIVSNCSRNSNSRAYLHLVAQPGRKLLAHCWPTRKNSAVLGPMCNRQLPALERSLHSPSRSSFS